MSTNALSHLPRLRIQSDKLRGRCKHRAAAGRDSVLRTALLVEATKGASGKLPDRGKGKPEVRPQHGGGTARMLWCDVRADSAESTESIYEVDAFFVNAFTGCRTRIIIILIIYLR